MKQVVIIHGGNSYPNYDTYLDHLKASPIDYSRLMHTKRWSGEGATNALSDFDVLTPSMPNKQNAVYEEWKIMFEKIIPFFSNDVQLVGHSLGAMFLAKYLHEIPLRTKIRRVVLISGGYNDEQTEDLGSFTVISATGIEQSAESVHLFHSTDDFVVPFSELAKFQADLPGAVSHIFDDRGHFLQPDFPELYDLLKQK